MNASNQTNTPVARAVKGLSGQYVLVSTAPCSSTSGNRRLTPKILGVPADKLPPKTLASLGSFHVLPPKVVNKLGSFRGALFSKALEVGVRFLNDVAVPRDRFSELVPLLDEVVASGNDYRDDVIRNYASITEEWIQRPEFAPWADLIRPHLWPVEYIARQIHFGWAAYTIGIGDEFSESSGVAASIEREERSMGERALEEVAVAASAVMRDSLHDEDERPRAEVTQKILSPIRRMADKLDGLSFADPRLVGVVQYIRGELAMLPSKGKMDRANLARIFSLVSALMDPAQIVKAASFSHNASLVLTAEDSEVVADMAAANEPCVVPVDATPVADDIASESSVGAPQVPADASLANATSASSDSVNVVAVPESDSSVSAESSDGELALVFDDVF